MRKKIKEVVEGRAPWPLLMISHKPGTGKTCAALVIADHCPLPSEYWTLSQLSSDCINRESETIEKLQGAELVIIDEIGTRSSSWPRDVLQKSLDMRECRPLVLCSNLRPAEFGEVYDSRIHSRTIVSGTVIDMSHCPDRRKSAIKLPWPPDPKQTEELSEYHRRCMAVQKHDESERSYKQYCIRKLSELPDDERLILADRAIGDMPEGFLKDDRKFNLQKHWYSFRTQPPSKWPVSFLKECMKQWDQEAPATIEEEIPF